MLAQADYTGLIIAAAIVASFVFTFALIYALGLFGWREWARQYPDRPLIEGKSSRWNSMSFERGTSYNNAVTITATRSGLRLRMPLLFRAGHPTIFVPWTELSISQVQRAFGTRVRLEANKVSRAILLPAKLADRLAEYAPEVHAR